MNHYRLVRALPAREFETLIKQVLADLGNNPNILQACVEAANRDATRSLASLQEEQRRYREEIAGLTAGIRRIIDIMKREDMVSADIEDEYRRLVREKEQLVTLCEKLQLDIERRQKRVLDAEIISRSLQDFERLVNLLPLDDQKELFQLLIREVEVHPFDPSNERLPAGRGAFATRVRSKWYQVNVTLHQLPGVDLGELANAENNLIDLRNELLSLEARCRRLIELYKDGQIDRAEFDREIQRVENRLRTAAPAVPLRDAVPNGLIYIGMSGNLAAREYDMHFNSRNTGFSTLRRSIGALLKEELTLVAMPRGSGRAESNYRNYRFKPDGEDKLTAWMKGNLEVGVYPTEGDHEAVEKVLIAALQPPLCLTGWPNPQGRLHQSSQESLCRRGPVGAPAPLTALTSHNPRWAPMSGSPTSIRSGRVTVPLSVGRTGTTSKRALNV